MWKLFRRDTLETENKIKDVYFLRSGYSSVIFVWGIRVRVGVRVS